MSFIDILDDQDFEGFIDGICVEALAPAIMTARGSIFQLHTFHWNHMPSNMSCLSSPQNKNRK